MNRIAMFALVAIAALVATPMSAQQDTAKPKVQQASGDVLLVPRRLPGRILKITEIVGMDTVPLEGVNVHEVVLGLQATTAKSGMIGLWAFRSPTDTVTIELTKIGYAPGTIKVADVTIDTSLVEVTMERVIALDTIKTNAARYSFVGAKAFEEMLAEKNFHGKYLDPEALRKYSGRQIRDVLKQKSMYPQFGGCKSPSLVYIDGMLATNATMLQALLDDPTDRFAAAVYYTGSEASVRYPPTMCGVLELFGRGEK